jgi:hypothetical protein
VARWPAPVQQSTRKAVNHFAKARRDRILVSYALTDDGLGQGPWEALTELQLINGRVIDGQIARRRRLQLSRHGTRRGSVVDRDGEFVYAATAIGEPTEAPAQLVVRERAAKRSPTPPGIGCHQGGSVGTSPRETLVQ